MDEKPAPNPQPPQQRNASLWLMLLGSPVIWLLSLQVSYSLVGYACLWQTRWPLFLTSLVSAFLALLNAGWGMARSRSLRHQPSVDAEVKRALFMARTGMGLSLLFALLISLQGVAVLFLDPCRL